jgi:2,4-dienoyl-CoA reductase (NADPH2)
MLQRRATRPGVNLGVSTGWILRSSLAKRDVKIMAGVTYERIDDRGLHVLVDGVPQLIEADTIVLCAGQEANRGPFDALKSAGVEVHIIGGAKEAAELDAMRAVDEGVRVGYAL